MKIASVNLLFKLDVCLSAKVLASFETIECVCVCVEDANVISECARAGYVAAVFSLITHVKSGDNEPLLFPLTGAHPAKWHRRTRAGFSSGALLSLPYINPIWLPGSPLLIVSAPL